MPPKSEEKKENKSVANAQRFQKFFGDADGDWILEQIDALTGHGKDTFSPDPYLNAYYSGRLSISAWIHALLKCKTNEDIENFLKGEER